MLLKKKYNSDSCSYKSNITNTCILLLFNLIHQQCIEVSMLFVGCEYIFRLSALLIKIISPSFLLYEFKCLEAC